MLLKMKRDNKTHPRQQSNTTLRVGGGGRSRGSLVISFSFTCIYDQQSISAIHTVATLRNLTKEIQQQQECTANEKMHYEDQRGALGCRLVS